MRAEASPTSAPIGNERQKGPRGGVHASSWAHKPPEWTTERSISGSWSGSAQPTSLFSSMLRLAQEEQLSRPFVQSQVVYSCIQARARAISGIGQAWWLDETSERRVEDLGTAQAKEFLRLMARPNPLMSSRKFWKLLETYYCLAGGVFLFLSVTDTEGNEGPSLRPIRPDEMPTSIWPIREDLVEPKFSSDNRNRLPDAWAFTTSDGEEKYPDHAVAHLYEADPYNALRGLGPMQAAFRRANVSFKAEAFDDAVVANGGQLGGILIPEKPLSKDQKSQLRDSWHQNVESARTHRRAAVMPAGIKYEKTAMTPVEMDFSSLRSWSREEIMMVFGVTKPLLGITDDVNRANAYEARRVFYESTILPQTEFWSDELAGSLLPKLPRWARDWSHQFQVDRIAALREQIDSQIDRLEKLMKRGRSFQEATNLIGWDADLDQMPGTEEHYLGTDLVPVDLAGMGRLAPQPPPTKEEKAEPKGLPRVYASGLTRGERVERSLAYEKFLRPFEDKIARGVRRIMGQYIGAVRTRLREIAKSASKETNGHPIREWEMISRETDIYGRPTYEEADPRIVVRNITEAELDRILNLSTEEWGKRLWDALEGPISGAIVASAADTAGLIGVGSFPVLESPDVLRFMADKEVLLVEGPIGTLREQVKRAIVKAMGDPNLVGTLGDRIREVLEELDDQVKALRGRLGFRGELIARTEAGSAANAGAVAQMKESDIERHEWLSSRDDLVRTEPVRHDIDGEAVKVGEPFSNGLRYPGDSEYAGGAGAVANCRCRTLPVIPRS